MAIIRGAKRFEGGDLSQKGTSYIKSGTRQVDFRNKEQGVFLFLLGAYKADKNGNGVWYKPLEIRDNFGLDLYKQKFAVQPNCPVSYFANKVRTFAAEMAKSQEIEVEGKKRWVYPAWGRSAYRVLYNAAIVNDYGSGVHVLDLPMSGGGSVIDEYVRGKDADGNDNPELHDYENAIPLNIKLDLKANGQPWKIMINPSKKYKLPVELADTEYLYNLDDVVQYPDKDELIEKLKSIVPTDIFNKGMEGYSSGDRIVVSMATPKKVAVLPTAPLNTDDDIPFEETPEAPISIPKSSVAPRVNIPKSNPVASGTDIPTAPTFAGSTSNSTALKAAQDFLRGGKK